MTGEQRIAASRQRVWDALNPDILQRSIPGCQSLEKEVDDRLRATCLGIRRAIRALTGETTPATGDHA